MQQVDKNFGPGDRLTQLVELLGFKSRYAMAKQLGIKRQTLDSIIKRNSVSPETALQIATALKVRPEWIMFGSGEIFQASSERITVSADPFASIPQRDSGVRDRLVKFQDLHDIGSISSLAGAAGVSVDELTSIMETGAISTSQAIRISTALHISVDWLLAGKGPMEKPGSEIQGNLGVDSSRPIEIITPGSVAKSGKSFVMVPKAETKLSAGGGIIPEEGTTGEEYAFRETWLRSVTSDPKRVMLLDVDGDSMAPTLLDKDTVLIDLNRTTLREGRIFAIGVGEVVQIKRLQLLPGGKIKVISDNEQYHSYEARSDEVRIIGQMIWSARSWL